MSDTIDLAQDHAALYLKNCISCVPKVVLTATGNCLSCGETIDPERDNKRFCDADCRDLYQKIERAKLFKPR